MAKIGKLYLLTPAAKLRPYLAPLGFELSLRREKLLNDYFTKAQRNTSNFQGNDTNHIEVTSKTSVEFG